jgi:hypothetical protein
MRYWVAVLLAGAAWGQQLDLSRLDGLSAKASESTNITLDADKLRMVSGFVEDKDKVAQGLLSTLKAIQVRAFEFDAAGAYSQSDLDGVRAQLKAPNWVRMIEVKEKDESAEIWFYSEGGKPGGLAVIAAEPKELAVVNLVGPIDLQTLGKLGGIMGIPNIRTGLLEQKKPVGSPKPDAAPKKDE